MIVRKLRQKDNGFIFYEPVGPWYGAYQVVNGERLALASNYSFNHPHDVLAEGHWDDIEERESNTDTPSMQDGKG